MLWLAPIKLDGIGMIRCSSLPRAHACPSSLVEDDYIYDSRSPYARRGSAVHDALAAGVMGLEPDLYAIATAWRMDLDELERLYHIGMRAWAALKHLFPHGKAEVRLTGEFASGTADVVDASGDVWRILDWKSGYVERDYSEQLLGYAHALACTMNDVPPGGIQCLTVYLELGTWEAFDVDGPMLQAFSERTEQLSRDAGRIYSPGEHCQYCPRQLRCQARADYLRASCNALVEYVGEMEARELAEVAGAKLAEAYPKIQQLERVVETYREAVRMALEFNGGRAPVGDGRTLMLLEQERQKVNVKSELWDVLARNGFTRDDRDACVSISKEALQKVVGNKAPPRQKGKYAAALVKELDQAGCITRKTFKKLHLGKTND